MSVSTFKEIQASGLIKTPNPPNQTVSVQLTGASNELIDMIFKVTPGMVCMNFPTPDPYSMNITTSGETVITSDASTPIPLELRPNADCYLPLIMVGNGADQIMRFEINASTGRFSIVSPVEFSVGFRIMGTPLFWQSRQ